jgi:hypothetical protein
MQQIRIVDEATRVPNTENMRLMLSEHPDQTWIARLRQLLATTAGGPALSLHVEGTSLVFACTDRADLVERRRLIGHLVDQVNASKGEGG